MIQNKSKTQTDKIRKARIEWLEGGVPRSARFDDPYYSRQDGLAETRHVFLEGNMLAERFAGCRNFVVAELGFGTGLNFLATASLWKETAPENAELAFFSFEQFPIAARDMGTALNAWPQLHPMATALTKAWEERPPDEGLFSFELGNVRLAVFLDDANTSLPKAQFAADAWFLDGFAPARNPQLWNDVLMGEVYAHTRPAGTLATYSAAGWVRRNLEAAGFSTTRQPGYGGKRQMTTAHRPR